MILDIVVDGQKIFFEIKDVAPIALRDMLQRSQYNKSIFLSLIITKPQLTAYEWYSQVPLNIQLQFIDRIYQTLEDDYV